MSTMLAFGVMEHMDADLVDIENDRVPLSPSAVPIMW